MATPTYELIETTTLASSASSVTFTSITQDYRDLVLVVNLLAASASNASVRINSDSASNYSRVFMLGSGSSATSTAQTTNTIFLMGNSATDTTNGILQIMDYSATDKHKSCLQRSNQDYVFAQAVRWADTSAVTALEIYKGANSFAVGSSFSLYGIAA